MSYSILFPSFVRTNVPVFVLRCRAEPIEAGLVSLVISVRKVEARHGKARVHELFEHGHFPTRRSERANDLGLPQRHIRLAQNGVERDVGAAEFRARTARAHAADWHPAADLTMKLWSREYVYCLLTLWKSTCGSVSLCCREGCEKKIQAMLRQPEWRGKARKVFGGILYK